MGVESMRPAHVDHMALQAEEAASWCPADTCLTVNAIY